VRCALVVALATIMASCQGDAGAGAAEAASVGTPVSRAPIEVFSWGGLQTDLVRWHEERHPLDEIIDANAQLSGAARKVLQQRLLQGDPPDSFQANAGFDLMQWVTFNKTNARESKLQALDDSVGISKATAALPPSLRAALSYEGQLYAVPANVHRINEVFFNPAVLRQVGLPLPRSIDDLFRLGKALKARGIPLLAIGSKDPWTLSVFIIEALLISQHGADFYEAYFTGKLRPDDPRMLETLETALRLLEYANANRDELYWEQAAELVFNGQAAMTVMGDWARTLFDSTADDVDERYRETTFPGSEAAFVYTCNTFSLPKRAKNELGARRLLTTITSAEGQAAIGRSKTSLPSRLDVDVDPNDQVQVNKQRLWRSGRLVLAQSGIVPPQFSSDLNQALKDMATEKRLSPVVHTLRARHPLLLGP
jgi:glucose/mannose transport system substrate-binding protein